MLPKISSSTYSDSKPHYLILDALRGIAAILVVAFHILETFTGGNHLVQIINHGYLAVDFFFLLSGFVIGYAYDDRWQQMTIIDFFKRRLIRLHPMIIIGMVIGAIGFYWSASPIIFPLVSDTSLWHMLVIMFIGFSLLPIPVSMDIRGWAEMHPLNGPAWSLLFEYIGNILYALFVRRFSDIALALLVFVAGCALVHFAVTSPTGDVVGGWSLDTIQLRVGFTRLIFPFFAGLLLSRLYKPMTFKNAMLWSSLLLVLALAMPRIGDAAHLWLNGLYDSLTIIVVFPLIVYMGANGKIEGEITPRVAQFLGDISYPIYITHYVLIYIFTAWVVNNNIEMQDAWAMSCLVFVCSIILAYTCLKLYDVPVRKWLTYRFSKKKN
jgi:peptidoglycan/LPS O-acetylase OafA/YrhL